MGHSLALCVGRAGCVEAVRWRRGKTAFISPGLSLPNAAEIVLNGWQYENVGHFGTPIFQVTTSFI
jgi:hypothetical protein